MTHSVAQLSFACCWLAVVSWLITLPSEARIRATPPRSTQFGRTIESPGLKLRITRKGAEYLKNVGVRLLNEHLSTLQGFRLQQEIQQPGLPAGQVFVQDIRALGYRPPTSSNLHFVSPNLMAFDISDAAITLSGRFTGGIGPFQISGTVYGQLFGLSISLVTQFRATADGRLVVNVANCNAQLQYTRFTLEPEGPFGPVLKIFETTINDLIRQRIPDRICTGIAEIIERNSPALFQRLIHIPVSEHFAGQQGEPSILADFIRKFTKGLFIDGRMVANPIVTPDFFETEQKGELRYYTSAGNAPFFPEPIPLDRDADRMLYLYASEYMLNSLLYHAYQLDKLTIQIEESSLPEPFQGFVRTSCPDIDQSGDLLKSICVGKLIPAIAKHFPNTTTKFLLLPHEVPEMKFSKGHATISLKGRILTYVRDRFTGKDRQILVSTAEGVADIRPTAENGTLRGDLKLRKLAVSLHRSAIEIDPNTISQLAPLAKTFLGPELAKGIKKGLPYPLKESINFIRPKLTVYDGGYVRLATDFELNERNLRPKVAEAFERIRNGVN